MKIKCGLLMLLFMGNAVAESTPMQTISMQVLTRQPVLDGDDSDWSAREETKVLLSKSKPKAKTNIDSVLIKGGVYAEQACFYLKWEDATLNKLHKSWLWDTKKNKYIQGPYREDRLALQFAISGEYSTDWLSGNTFTADMWHWKASRSNPLGLAHDKSTVISDQKLLRAYKGFDRNNKPIYIYRPSDSGDKIYKTKRYRAYQENIMPKYLLNESAQGSVTDVKAKGEWRNGKWHLELCRQFNTGNSDDVVFVKGQTVLGGIAIFDQSENYDHAISNTLLFQF